MNTDTLTIVEMSIDAKKLSLIEELAKVKEETILQKVEAALSERIVVYTVDGEPLTKQAYNARLAESERQIERGEYYTTEELIKAIKG